MSTVLMAAPTIVTNMTGFFTIRRGFELLERIADAPGTRIFGVKDGNGFGVS